MIKQINMGRIVITHSTYIEGLIPKLKELADNSSIQTITPGVIKRTKGRGGRLELRISTSIRGGFKLIARKGYKVQEVFIITTLNETDLYDCITKMFS